MKPLVNSEKACQICKRLQIWWDKKGQLVKFAPGCYAFFKEPGAAVPHAVRCFIPFDREGRENLNLRNLSESDYKRIIPVVDDWWGGRQVSHLLQKLFFRHFKDTCFIMEDNDQIIGFLVGFVSQSYPEEAYIHFVGVHPDYREKGIGSKYGAPRCQDKLFDE